MALSNTKREPRRENTETIIGVLGLGLILTAAWYLGRFGIFVVGLKLDSGVQGVLEIILSGTCSLAAIGIGSLFLWGLLNLAHSIGESVCDLLPKDPRPRWRVDDDGSKYVDYGRTRIYQIDDANANHMVPTSAWQGFKAPRY